LTDLKTYGTTNKLTHYDITGQIPTTKIDGLSALAFKDKIEISDVNSLQTELDSKVSSVVVTSITDETNGEPLATISVNGTETTIYGGTGNGQSGVANIGVGTIVAFAGEGVIPENTLLCDGREVSISDYELLYAVIGDRYGDAAEGMFKLPDLTNRFIEGCSAISDVGTYLEAGLPNITGRVGVCDDNVSPTGAFYTNSRGGQLENAAGEPDPIILMDASRSSKIYGNSDTVQPPAVMMRYVIVHTALNG
jgi:hypothetical protein